MKKKNNNNNNFLILVNFIRYITATTKKKISFSHISHQRGLIFFIYIVLYHESILKTKEIFKPIKLFFFPVKFIA